MRRNACLIGILSGLTMASLFVTMPIIADDRLLAEDRSVVADKLMVAKFSSQDRSNWKEKIFDNETRYAFTQVENEWVLKATSQNAASGLFREIPIDLKKYPYLNWRWRITKSLQPVDETRKAGDDYVARIYVVKSGDFFFWKTKALNYVWSSRPGKNISWPNAFAPDNTRMLSVRSSVDEANIWYEEKRNVYEDLKHWLGEEVDQIDAIAIMTDTDNTGGQAEAYYGDIFFSVE